MNINRKYVKIIGAIIALIIFYIIGNLIPIEAFKPEVRKEAINTGEYYRLIISIISAVITFCAVLVALFKDDLRELWKYPKIIFANPENGTVEITEEEDSGSGSGDTIIQAVKYLSRIEVKNAGNLPTMNAEVYLDKLEFREKNSTIPQFIETTGVPMQWNGDNIKSIIIPPGGKKLINLVEVLAPAKISLPNSAQTNQPAKLLIGGITNNNDQKKGTWSATFSLYAQNHKPTYFVLEIEWSGVWKRRLTEMTSQLKIEVKNGKK